MSEPDNFQRLNEEFYASTPSTYFRDRLKLLALRAAKPDAVEEAIGDGIAWGQLRIEHEDADAAPDAAVLEEAAHTRFVVTESQVLLHHAAEALLRMFLAHEGRPDCPWLEMASLLDFSRFRDEVGELAKSSWPADRETAVEWVFLGGVALDPPPVWIEHRAAAIRLVRLLAQRVNSDKNLYNAAKHGLTAIGGTGSVVFIPEEPGQPSPLTAAGFDGEALERAVLGADGVNVT